ncbi:MAG TPA: pyridoxal phosphate-dependent aminotransferase [Verrucomicrobiae bacterium]|nr:pyridoxal phosphate-dependent aminotransferase [Verrucomicrobiae bacterium]
MDPIAQTVAAIEESATLAVDRRARELAAAGIPVISFGAGEPDFPTPDHVVEAALAACRDPRDHHYSAAAGLADLRRAIAEKTLRDSHVLVTPDQVLVTNGSKQAVAHAFTTLLDPGDEVLIPSPYWVTYPETVRLARGRPVMVAGDPRNGHRIDPERLERARTVRTKVLLLNSPVNPTGTAYSADELAAIGAWALAHELWVVCDEIYEHLVYPPLRFHSLLQVVPELQPRTLILNGVAKSYAMTGWRVGWLIAPPAVVQAAANLQSHVCGNVANVSQRAAIAALDGPTESLTMMRTAFDRRRQVLVEGLRAIPGVVCPMPDAAFYVFPDVRGALGRSLGGRAVGTTSELAEALLDTARVAVVPGEAFGCPGHLRLAFALADDSVREGVARLRAALG